MGFNLFRSKVPGVPSYNYNPEIEKPIIKASICNGEQVADSRTKQPDSFPKSCSSKITRILTCL